MESRVEVLTELPSGKCYCSLPIFPMREVKTLSNAVQSRQLTGVEVQLKLRLVGQQGHRSAYCFRGQAGVHWPLCQEQLRELVRPPARG